MITTITCPACGLLSAKRDCIYDVQGLLEERIACSCGYYYEFLYGYYLEKYPKQPAKTWSWDNPITCKHMEFDPSD